MAAFTPELGQLVDVAGRVTEWHGRRQVTVSRVTRVADPNAEPLRWLETLAIRHDVLAKPFELPVRVPRLARGATTPRTDARH